VSESTATTLSEPAVLSMTWRDALFAHWAVEPERIAETLPDRLTVDSHDGDAYLGVVPFVMERIAPPGVPFGLSFGEVNLRTYVRGDDGTRGVYFYNLDADDRLGVALARQLFELPYYRAEITVERGDREVRFRSRRLGDGEPAAFDATYGPDGSYSEPTPGSLPHFLTERYRFYTAGDDALYYGDIAHEPWPLTTATAELRTNDLFAVNGFDRPASEPLYHYSPRLDVAAGRVHRV
jgi:uncharacterized protein YqjF (DUF2071 family)